MKIPQGIQLTSLDEMTPSAARVLIARDCLKWLEEKTIEPTTCVYMDFDVFEDGHVYDPQVDTDVNKPMNDLRTLAESGSEPAHLVVEQIPENATCTLCALGLAALASVCRFNDVQARDLAAYQTDLLKYLGRFFDKEQLLLMERVFENSADYDDHRLCARGIRAINRAYPGSRHRIRAIFQSIVDNDGEFALSSFPEYNNLPELPDEDELELEDEEEDFDEDSDEDEDSEDDDDCEDEEAKS